MSNHQQLIERLCQCNAAQLDKIITLVGLPRQFLSAPSVAPATRATEIIELAKKGGVEALGHLDQAVANVFGLLPCLVTTSAHPQITNASPQHINNGDDRFDVFLSYNRNDSEIVIRIKEELRCRGLRVWIDHESLRPGQVWTDELDGIMRRVKVALVCFGPAGLGQWQQDEVHQLKEHSVERDMKLIPIRLPEAAPELPVWLRRYQWLDMNSTPFDDSLNDLEKEIRTANA